MRKQLLDNNIEPIKTENIANKSIYVELMTNVVALNGKAKKSDERISNLKGRIKMRTNVLTS